MLLLFVLVTFLKLLELRVYSMGYGDIAIQSYERVVLSAAHLNCSQKPLPAKLLLVG
jgi:hypothetical protein